MVQASHEPGSTAERYALPDLPLKDSVIAAEGLDYRCGQLRPPIKKSQMRDPATVGPRQAELDRVEPWFKPAEPSSLRQC